MAYGISYLRSKCAKKRHRVDLRYEYYEMKHIAPDLHISTPKEIYWLQQKLGWCAKAVDALADRLQFREFRYDNFDLTTIYQLNNSDILMDSAIRSALIASCCFIYVSADADGFPRLQVIDGANATGIIDPITGMLSEGYAVLDRDEYGKPTTEAYFVPGRTDIYKANVFSYSVAVSSNYCALVPVIHRPDAKRPFGHSRISRTCMDLQDSAVRTIKRSEISAEFYSYPQKYVTGLSDAAEIDTWKATISSMMMFTKDEDGDKPSVGQFSQQSMAPHTEQLRMFASMFGGETGLTLDDLGFASGNPSSAEAIKAAHENLRMAARKAQANFATGFINAGIVAASIRDAFPYWRKAFYRTKVIWEPLFEPDATQLSAIGDGAIKINQAIPDYMGQNNLYDLTGIDPEA